MSNRWGAPRKNVKLWGASRKNVSIMGRFAQEWSEKSLIVGGMGIRGAKRSCAKRPMAGFSENSGI